jgi:hypothetical protein
MSKLAVDNIVTVANIFTFINTVKTKIGYEWQAPLDADTQNENTSRAIREVIAGAVDND